MAENQQFLGNAEMASLSSRIAQNATEMASVSMRVDVLSGEVHDTCERVAQNVSVTIFSDQKAKEKLTDKILDDFYAARHDVKLNLRPTNNKLHDRYIFLDFGLRSEKLFHCGTSSKDAGGKITTIMQVECPQVYHAMIEELDK